MSVSAINLRPHRIGDLPAVDENEEAVSLEGLQRLVSLLLPVDPSARRHPEPAGYRLSPVRHH